MTAKSSAARYIRRKAPKPPPQREERPKPRNKKKSQRPPHPGEEERIAERRVRALKLRQKGMGYRAIARECKSDLRTAYDDVQAELRALREQATDAAEQVKDLELARCDAHTEALSKKCETGDVQAIQATIRVMERRAKLLGLDAPSKVQGTLVTISAEKLKQVSDEKLQALQEAALLAVSLSDGTR